MFATSALLENVAPLTASTSLLAASVALIPSKAGSIPCCARSKKSGVSALGAAAIFLTVPSAET